MPDIIYIVLNFWRMHQNKMNNFIAKNEEILQNSSGTNQMPILFDIIQGKTGKGHSIITKIGNVMYSALKRKLNKNRSCSLRCKDYRNQCAWTGKIQNISNLEADPADFWKVENWIVIPIVNSEEHTCTGIEVQQVASQQMREFVKTSYDEGITNFKIIKNVSGLESTFADHAAELIGDDQTYQRILQLKRKRKNPEAAVPPELEIMQTWDPISKSKIPEPFIHHKTFDFLSFF